MMVKLRLMIIMTKMMLTVAMMRVLMAVQAIKGLDELIKLGTEKPID